MTYAVPMEVALNLIEVANSGRAIQGAWRKQKPNGEELVCALAAFGDNINSPSDCPSKYMPRWLAELIPTLDDGIAKDKVPDFFIGLGRRAKQWHVMSDDQWETVRVKFLVACVEQGFYAAEQSQDTTKPSPAYWTQVRAACNQVVTALKAKNKPAAAYAARAANAARAAANAADAAANAAYAAANAANAAYAADAAYAAARAARSNQYWSLVQVLFDAFDAELGQ